MGGPPLLQIVVPAVAAIAAPTLSMATYRILLHPAANRASRIIAGVVGGLLVGVALYFTFTDLIGAAIGVGLDMAWLLHGRAGKTKADFVVRDDALLDEAVSPELGADLEGLARHISRDAGSTMSFDMPDLPPMPGVLEERREVSDMPDSLRPTR